MCLLTASYVDLTSVKIWSSNFWKYNQDTRQHFLWMVTFSDCWHQESHQRPTFAEILRRLDEISTSPFMTTPQESFHTMQEDWRQEIEEMFNELRSKEKVTLPLFRGDKYYWIESHRILNYRKWLLNHTAWSICVSSTLPCMYKYVETIIQTCIFIECGSYKKKRIMKRMWSYLHILFLVKTGMWN